jgi:Recombinational DNA repair ATPase (RecF pathway)
MINNISISNFTNFQRNTFKFSNGINVFIGKNGTGKTHVLKSLAATINANNSFLSGLRDSKEFKGGLIAENLIAYFKPDKLGNLVHKTVPQPKPLDNANTSSRLEANINISIDNKRLEYRFSSIAQTNVSISVDDKWEKIDSLYIPPREMLSLFEGFIGLTEKREISFDDTYISLAKALNVPLLKEGYNNPLQGAIDILQKELNFKVIQANGRFYIKDEYRQIEAHLVAEGFRKLASVMYLILNGELKENSILFWDEPEANLNPTLIKVVVLFMLELSRCGIQLFIATHDYLLTHLLSLYAEYRNLKDTPDMKFFCLSTDSNNIVVEEGTELSAIENNPILNEYADFYNLEQQFLKQSFE